MKSKDLLTIGLVGAGIYLLYRIGGFKILGSVGDVAEGAGDFLGGSSDLLSSTLSNVGDDLSTIGQGLSDATPIIQATTGIEPFSEIRAMEAGLTITNQGINVPQIIANLFKSKSSTPINSGAPLRYVPSVNRNVLYNPATGQAVASTTPALQSMGGISRGQAPVLSTPAPSQNMSYYGSGGGAVSTNKGTFSNIDQAIKAGATMSMVPKR
jgi:hypothetical protein